MNDFDLTIIGGGASGFFAAIVAAEAHPGLRIAILERSDWPLAKVRISGGGRCNLTHACYDPAELATYYPRGAKELRGPFSRFQPRDTVDWFTTHGVPLKTEPDGRIFPQSNRSESVVTCLLDLAKQSGIVLRTRSRVDKIQKTSIGFVLSNSAGQLLSTNKVLLAAGGLQAADSLAATLGHTIIPAVPSLFTFSVKDARIDGLAGISMPDCILRLEFQNPTSHHFTARGPLLITHWGLSGPAVLRLSAWGARDLARAGYSASLNVNWLPAHSPENLLAAFQTTRLTHPRQNPEGHNPIEGLPQRLWKSLLAAAGVEPGQTWGTTSNRLFQELVGQLTTGIFQIQGKGIFKDEFVTCGGVKLAEVNFRTMESRICPGLFFAGEVLDIDGLTGGFNFQAAWTTGWIAGRAIADLG